MMASGTRDGVIDFVGRRIFQKYPFLVENKAGLDKGSYEVTD